MYTEKAISVYFGQAQIPKRITQWFTTLFSGYVSNGSWFIIKKKKQHKASQQYLTVDFEQLLSRYTGGLHNNLDKAKKYKPSIIFCDTEKAQIFL